jgi:uncharacterized protein involved in exopolysaccharide biosynthesis
VVRDDFSVNADDRFDEIDQAATDIEQSMQREFAALNSLVQTKLAAVERAQAEIVDRVAAAARRASKVPVTA